MSLTSVYKTRSEIIDCKNLECKDYALSALDIGYSAVKGFSATKRICIPSYAREYTADIIGKPHKTDILYKDDTNTVYAVGTLAAEGLSDKDTNDDANTMYSRNRYFSTSFLILARVGLGLTLDTNETRPICLQTGLPPAYRKADTLLLKEALSGSHHFWLKVGANDWTEYYFQLDENNIYVIDQPVGSIYSASKRNDGSTTLCEDGKPYISHRVLVLDGGFGTLDIYSLNNRMIDSTNTFNDLGMKAVFEGAAQEIFERFGKEIHIHTLQNYLQKGTITVFDRKNRATKEEDISEIILRHTKLVCDKAMTRIEAAYDNLENYDYLIVTGGTGASWLPLLEERYKNMETLSVISANQNDNIAPIYNNVRGYYIFRVLSLSK